MLLCSLQSTAALSALPDLSYGVATGCRGKAERSYESQPVHMKAAGLLSGDNLERHRGGRAMFALRDGQSGSQK